jgi:hypothetical protein
MTKTNKYLIIVITLIVFLISVKNCQKILQGENTQLLKQVEQLKDEATIVENERIKQKDSLNQEISAKEIKIKDLSNQITQSNVRLQKSPKEHAQNKERIRQLESFEKLAQEYNDIYNTNQAVATNQGVELTKDLPYLVLESLFDFEHCRYENKEQFLQLSLKDEQIKLKDLQIYDKDLLIVSAENSLSKHKSLVAAQEELANTLQSENKQLKKSKWVEKWIIRPLLLGGGIYIGNRLIK